MKNKYFRATLALLLTFCVLQFPMPAQSQVLNSQGLNNWLNAIPVAGVSTGDDTDTALLVRYIGVGTANSGTVEVSVTTSDITFLQGVQGAEAASTELECPVSGALGGILDVSNAACNTLGEIADVINASASWRAVILDGVRSDVWDARGVTMSATRATSLDGVGLKWDTSTAFMYTQALVPTEYRSMRAYIRASGTGVAAGTGRVEPSIYDNSQTAFLVGNATSTFGSGTSNLQILSVKVGKYNRGSNTNSEVVTTMYIEPGGATTVNKIFDDAAQAGGIQARPDEKMVVRLSNSAAAATVSFRAYGLFRHRQ